MSCRFFLSAQFMLKCKPAVLFINIIINVCLLKKKRPSKREF